MNPPSTRRRGGIKAWRDISQQLADDYEIAFSQLESTLATFLSNFIYQQKKNV